MSMESNKSWGMRNVSGKKAHIIVRLCLAVFALVGGIAIAWTMFGPHAQSYATSGITEYPTQTNPWGVTLDVTRGHVWVAEPGCDSSPVCSSPPPGLIGRYTLSNPAVGSKNFVPPSPAVYNPVFLALDGSGNVWFTD